MRRRRERLPDRGRVRLKCLPVDLAVLISFPMCEHRLDLPHQIVPQSFDLGIGVVNQGLEITFQVSPVPLQPFGLPIHLGTVAIDNTRESVPQQLRQGVAFAAGENSEDREPHRHGRPQPSLVVRLLDGSFIHVQLGFFSQLFFQLVVGMLQHRRDLILHLDGGRGTTRNAEQVLQEQGGPSLTLTEVGHQQPREGHQPRSRLSGGDTCGKWCAGRFPTARTGQAMSPILRDQGLDDRQLPYLVPHRLGIFALQACVTPAAIRRMKIEYLVAFLVGESVLVRACRGRAVRLGVVGSLASSAAASHADVGCWVEARNSGA